MGFWRSMASTLRSAAELLRKLAASLAFFAGHGFGQGCRPTCSSNQVRLAVIQASLIQLSLRGAINMVQGNLLDRHDDG